jgi:hypothetical protein
MSHDKTKAAARERMAKTGEPYAAARRAVVAEHESDGEDGGGYALRMSDGIHEWLTGLRSIRSRNMAAAKRAVQAVAALMSGGGADLGDPLVISPADSWSWALAAALDRSYEEGLERVTALRRGEADAATLVKDIQDQYAELEPAARRMLPRMIEARDRLRDATQRLQSRVNADRVRKEVLKAQHVAARGTIKAHEAMVAMGTPDDESREAISAAEGRIAEFAAQMERELGLQAWPEGLMELRPGAPVYDDVRILFAVEPARTVLLIAVIDGMEAVEDQYLEALMAAADMLRRVRAGEAAEAGVCAYDDVQSFLNEFEDVMRQ